MKIRALILAAATAASASAAPLAASAQVLPWPLNAVLPGWANGNWQYGANVPSGGVVASVQGSSFTLQNGKTVIMHPGTVINPTGTRLQPGMRVSLLGTPNGPGRFNANEVDVNGYAQGGYGAYGPNGYGRPYGYAPYPYGYAPGPNYRYREDRDRDDRHWNRGEHRGWVDGQPPGQYRRDHDDRD
jgi:hypothetical protein